MCAPSRTCRFFAHDCPSRANPICAESGYADNFCDAMDELKSTFSAQGAEIIGAWSTDGYDHEDSKSVDGGKFVGLPCDEDNESDQSEDRVNAWIDQIKGEGMPL